MFFYRRRPFFPEMQVGDLSFFLCIEMGLCKDREAELLIAGLLNYLKGTASPLPLSGLQSEPNP